MSPPLDRTHKPRRRLRPNVERLMRYHAVTELVITVKLVITLVLCVTIRLPVLPSRIVIVIIGFGSWLWRLLTPESPFNQTKPGQSFPMAGVDGPLTVGQLK